MSPSGCFPEEKRRQQAQSGKLVRILSCPSVSLPFSPSLMLSFLKLPILQTWFQESKALRGMIFRNPTHSAWAEFQHWSRSIFMVTQRWLWCCPGSSGTWLCYWALSPEHKHSTLVILVPLWKRSCPAVSFLVSQKILLFRGMAPFGFGLFIADVCVLL